MINSKGIITTYAGNGATSSAGDNGPATSASLSYPRGLGLDNNGNLYIADYLNNKVRMVNSAGIITTFAGSGIAGTSGDGGAAVSAQMGNPNGVSADTSGNVYILDYTYSKIRLVNSAGIITTFAGTGSFGSSGDGGPATSASFSFPYGVAVDSSNGNVYIADNYNNKIRVVQPGTYNPLHTLHCILPPPHNTQTHPITH